MRDTGLMPESELAKFRVGEEEAPWPETLAAMTVIKHMPWSAFGFVWSEFDAVCRHVRYRCRRHRRRDLRTMVEWAEACLLTHLRKSGGS